MAASAGNADFHAPLSQLEAVLLRRIEGHGGHGVAGCADRLSKSVLPTTSLASEPLHEPAFEPSAAVTEAANTAAEDFTMASATIDAWLQPWQQRRQMHLDRLKQPLITVPPPSPPALQQSQRQQQLPSSPPRLYDSDGLKSNHKELLASLEAALMATEPSRRGSARSSRIRPAEDDDCEHHNSADGSACSAKGAAHCTSSSLASTRDLRHASPLRTRGVSFADLMAEPEAIPLGRSPPCSADEAPSQRDAAMATAWPELSEDLNRMRSHDLARAQAHPCEHVCSPVLAAEAPAAAVFAHTAMTRQTAEQAAPVEQTLAHMAASEQAARLRAAAEAAQRMAEAAERVAAEAAYRADADAAQRAAVEAAERVAVEAAYRADADAAQRAAVEAAQRAAAEAARRVAEEAAKMAEADAAQRAAVEAAQMVAADAALRAAEEAAQRAAADAAKRAAWTAAASTFSGRRVGQYGPDGGVAGVEALAPLEAEGGPTAALAATVARDMEASAYNCRDPSIHAEEASLTRQAEHRSFLRGATGLSPREDARLDAQAAHPADEFSVPTGLSNAALELAAAHCPPQVQTAAEWPTIANSGLHVPLGTGAPSFMDDQMHMPWPKGAPSFMDDQMHMPWPKGAPSLASYTGSPLPLGANAAAPSASAATGRGAAPAVLSPHLCGGSWGRAATASYGADPSHAGLHAPQTPPPTSPAPSLHLISPSSTAPREVLANAPMAQAPSPARPVLMPSAPSAVQPLVGMPPPSPRLYSSPPAALSARSPATPSAGAVGAARQSVCSPPAASRWQEEIWEIEEAIREIEELPERSRRHLQETTAAPALAPPASAWPSVPAGRSGCDHDANGGTQPPPASASASSLRQSLAELDLSAFDQRSLRDSTTGELRPSLLTRMRPRTHSGGDPALSHR